MGVKFGVVESIEIGLLSLYIVGVWLLSSWL